VHATGFSWLGWGLNINYWQEVKMAHSPNSLGSDVCLPNNQVWVWSHSVHIQFLTSWA